MFLIHFIQFLGRDKDDSVRRSAVSGKKVFPLSLFGPCITVMTNSCDYWSLILHLQIQLKLDKSKEDKAAESKRNELLKFLNASYD